MTYFSGYFNPLGREYCSYFYWLSVIAFIFLLLALVDSVANLLKGKINLLTLVVSLFGPFLLYFNNRLLYSMCVK
jgi:uncharacterized membrane protein YhaH (DUF805 family)